MAKTWSLFLKLTMVFMASSSLPLASSELPISVISAAPAVLPFEPPLSSPVSSPSLSPDISPLFPTPAGPSPAESSSVPIIPSSPSPPNPDEMIAPGPIIAFPPSGLMPDSSAFIFNAFGIVSSLMLQLLGLVAVFG